MISFFSNTLFTSCKLLTLLSCFLHSILARHQRFPLGINWLSTKKLFDWFRDMVAFIFIGVHILFLHSEMSIILGLCMGIRVAICPLNLKLSVIIIWCWVSVLS